MCLAADGEECIRHGISACACDCQCELINKVRADTVEQIWLAVKKRQKDKENEKSL